jgi:hypothetical protein
MFAIQVFVEKCLKTLQMALSHTKIVKILPKFTAFCPHNFTTLMKTKGISV